LQKPDWSGGWIVAQPECEPAPPLASKEDGIQQELIDAGCNRFVRRETSEGLRASLGLMGASAAHVTTIGETASRRSETYEDIAGVYLVHGPRAKRLAYLLTGDWSAAEEITQEAFVRLIGRFGHLRKPEATAVYLRRIVINLANSYLRRLRLERAHRSEAGRSANRATELPDIETRDELMTELQQLPPRQRAALVLRYCEDLSEHEVASILRTSEKAVRSLAARGLGTSRVTLDEGTR
jgi:RNA polymerase sigma factor (sigma-70 family)